MVLRKVQLTRSWILLHWARLKEYRCFSKSGPMEVGSFSWMVLLLHDGGFGKWLGCRCCPCTPVGINIPTLPFNFRCWVISYTLSFHQKFRTFLHIRISSPFIAFTAVLRRSNHVISSFSLPQERFPIFAPPSYPATFFFLCSYGRFNFISLPYKKIFIKEWPLI